MNKLTEQYIVDILIEEMNLNTNNVWIANQNRKIPNDLGVYISVGLVDSQVFSSVNTVIPTNDGMNEIQQLQIRENIQIDILSRSNDGLTRKYEVLAALKSIYSVQTQEANWFRIFPVSNSFVNTSSAEGGSQLNRFTIIIACHSWFRKEKVVSSSNGDYFDSFMTAVYDNYETPPVRITDDGYTRITAAGDTRIAFPAELIEFNIP